MKREDIHKTLADRKHVMDTFTTQCLWHSLFQPQLLGAPGHSAWGTAPKGTLLNQVLDFGNKTDFNVLVFMRLSWTVKAT